MSRTNGERTAVELSELATEVMHPTRQAMSSLLHLPCSTGSHWLVGHLGDPSVAPYGAGSSRPLLVVSATSGRLSTAKDGPEPLGRISSGKTARR